MNSLGRSLVLASPRLTPRHVPVISLLISVGGWLLFASLLAQSFYRQGVFGWSIGMAYIAYDTALLLFTAVQIWPLRHALRQPPPSATRPSFGVIVAAHNEAGVLSQTIERLTSQGDPPDLILLADDGSTDATAETLTRLYRLAAPAYGGITPASAVVPSLKWLRLRHGGKARALNAAILHIDTDIVLTVDADTLLDRGAIGAMRDAFGREPALVAATGVLTPICGPELSGRLFEWFQTYEYVRNFLSRYAWMQLDSLLLISGAFAAFRRDAVVTVGGFDTDCLVEDYELIHRLHRHAADNGLDWRVRVVGGAHAMTDAPATPMAFLRQRRRWFGGFLQTQHWNRDMTGNARFGRLGTAMMPVKALDTLQPIYGLAAFAVLVGLVVTGRYAIALPILLIMLAKIVIDLTFHLWSLRLYARWTAQAEPLAVGPALLAALLEPFSFQLLRHAGAVWGWVAFLTGGQTWGRQRRTALENMDRPVR